MSQLIKTEDDLLTEAMQLAASKIESELKAIGLKLDSWAKDCINHHLMQTICMARLIGQADVLKAMAEASKIRGANSEKKEI